MKRKATGIASLCLVTVLAVACSGCGLATAARIMKSYRITLGGVQDTEIAIFHNGFITPAQHTKDQADIEKLANYGAIADTAILNSDKATLKTDVQNGLTTVAAIEANDVTAIGDPTSRAEIEVAMAGLGNLLNQAAAALGVQ